MSQWIVFRTLKSFDQGATRKELVEKIEEEFPERTLSMYLGDRLSTLVDKEAVLEDIQNSTPIYKTNPDYSSEDLAVSLMDFDSRVSQEELRCHGIEVTNIVGSGIFSGSIDLQQLATEIVSVEYEPETSPMAIWRPFEKNTTAVLIPSTGNVTIVGSKNRAEIIEVINKMYAQLTSYAKNIISQEDFITEFQINNIAASGTLEQELKLSTVAINLGLEEVEYEPEQFPGIVYRPKSGIVTLIFNSGSVIITAKSYESVLEGWQKLREDLEEIGVPFPNS